MLDKRFILENAQVVQENCNRRGVKVDVDRFVAFLEGLRDQSRLALGDVTFDIASCRVIRDGS